MCGIRRRRSVSVWLLAAFAGVLLAGSIPCDVSAAPTIKFKKNGLDRFKFHGRVRLVPPEFGGPVDPLVDPFGVEILNEKGTVYQAWLDGSDLEPRRGMRYKFKDRAARYGLGGRGGLYQVITRFRNYGGVWYYTVRIMAFASLGRATEPLMSVTFLGVDGMATVTAEWVRKAYGWRLPLGRF